MNPAWNVGQHVPKLFRVSGYMTPYGTQGLKSVFFLFGAIRVYSSKVLVIVSWHGQLWLARISNLGLSLSRWAQLRCKRT